MIPTTARTAHQELEARLRPFVARRVPSSADVDDIVQEVFLRMQRGIASLRDDQRFGAWVYQVARSAIADHRRARVRHPLTDREPEELPAEAEDGGVDLAAYVAPFVAMLPSPYREALTLTELEGLTQKEAAEMLGLSVSGMKSRVQRGRAQLRELFDQCCKLALDVRGRVIACEPRPNSTTKCDC